MAVEAPMTEKHTLIVRRVLFWLVITTLIAIAGLAWWWLALIKLGHTIAPEVIITGIDRGETVVLLLAIMCSCFPAAMWAGGQPLKRAELEHAFRVKMDDVVRAYYAAHAADRSGVFKLTGEFDAMRERMEWLSDHPELQALTPDLRLLGAQMSIVTRDLARRYSDEVVQEVDDLLTHSERDCDQFEEQVNRSLEAQAAIRTRVQKLDLRYATAYSQDSAVTEAIEQELEPLGLKLDKSSGSNVLTLKQNPSE